MPAAMLAASCVVLCQQTAAKQEDCAAVAGKIRHAEIHLHICDSMCFKIYEYINDRFMGCQDDAEDFSL